MSYKCGMAQESRQPILQCPVVFDFDAGQQGILNKAQLEAELIAQPTVRPKKASEQWQGVITAAGSVGACPTHRRHRLGFRLRVGCGATTFELKPVS